MLYATEALLRQAPLKTKNMFFYSEMAASYPDYTSYAGLRGIALGYLFASQSLASHASSNCPI